MEPDATRPEPAAVPRPLETGEILTELAQAPAGVTGTNARKAFVLRKYLERIRQGSQRHVP